MSDEENKLHFINSFKDKNVRKIMLDNINLLDDVNFDFNEVKSLYTCKSGGKLEWYFTLKNNSVISIIQ